MKDRRRNERRKKGRKEGRKVRRKKEESGTRRPVYDEKCKIYTIHHEDPAGPVLPHANGLCD
jgi:hypothetical protein